MKKSKKMWVVTPITAILCSALVLFSVPMYFYNPTLFYVLISVAVLLIITALIYAKRIQKWAHRYLKGVASTLCQEDYVALESVPMPVLLISPIGEIVWYNERFRGDVLSNADAYGAAAGVMFEGITTESLEQGFLPCVIHGEKTYAVYVIKAETIGEAYVLYFADITELTEIATEYANSRPVVLSLYIDNGDEVLQDMRNSERAQILSQVETLLEDWISANVGIFRKCGSDRFLALVESRALDGMVNSRFDILDRVRAVKTVSGNSLTLSVGVGMGATLFEAESHSRQSLDMALGRGGDQVAVKTDSGFDFYGGLSKSVEKRTKVRTRVMALALADMIQNCENVLLMGHRYSDLDCLGSCAALTELCRSLGKPAYTVYDPKTTLANVLVERYEDDIFIDSLDAFPLLNDNTLLIITDIHETARLDFPELYRRAKTVVVIDHHRKMVDYINNAKLFYHEPNASSASEMVAELAQYMPKASLSRIGAEALLAGIMLDTRSFVMKSGVRTFEAAAYLKRMGADTVKVKRLFSESMEQSPLTRMLPGSYNKFKISN